MRIRTLLLACLCALSLVQSSWAHPGHVHGNGSSEGLVHYLTHPDHLTQWVILAAIAGFISLVARMTRKRLSPAYARVRKSN